MRRLILSVSVGIMAVAMALPSFAADLPRRGYYKAPVAPAYVAPLFTWSGFYIGINGGYGWGKSDWSSTATTGSTSPDGGLIGVTLGYNVQTDVWVWGFEGDFDASWLKGSDNTGTGVCSGTDGCETKVPWFATARARVGYALGRWLPYITGGAAFADVKMTPNGGGSDTDTRVGWTVGGGIEYAFLGPWSAKLEYLYSDLGTASCSAATCGVDTNVDFTASMVRAGINYRF